MRGGPGWNSWLTEIKQSRMAEFIWLRELPISNEDIAKRMGVNVRTVHRYTKELLAAGRIRPKRTWHTTRQQERTYNQARHPDGRFM